MKKYTTLFFDLDNTLWDFDRNSIDALTDIHKKYMLCDFCTFEEFIKIYQKHNHEAWALYKKNIISVDEVKENRFKYTFEELGIDIKFNLRNISEDYLKILATKTIIYPQVKETLEELSKHYKLHILSNGFLLTQISKLKNCNLLRYFDKIITSEAANSKKPDPGIFEYALKVTDTSKEEVIYIGDEYETDIIGAHNAGIDSVWFNPNEISIGKENIEPTFIVKKFGEIIKLLRN